MSTYEDPGVAFRETIVPVAHFDSDWTTRPCNSVWSLEKPQRAGVTRPGPRPLVAMAMTVVTRNITRDSESAFTSLNAPRILEQIWANIEDWSAPPFLPFHPPLLVLILAQSIAFSHSSDLCTSWQAII